jgi:hypothetical protein
MAKHWVSRRRFTGISTVGAGRLILGSRRGRPVRAPRAGSSRSPALASSAGRPDVTPSPAGAESSTIYLSVTTP